MLTIQEFQTQDDQNLLNKSLNLKNCWWHQYINRSIAPRWKQY